MSHDDQSSVTTNTQIMRSYAQQYLRREIDLEALNSHLDTHGWAHDGIDDPFFLSSVGLGCIQILTKKKSEEEFRHDLIKLLTK